LKKHNNSGKKNEATSKRKRSPGPVQRDTKEVLAELVGKLKERLDPKKVAATSAGEKHQRGELRPNLDRLTVGVDLGDQWSNYCILGLEGETLVEGQVRTTPLGLGAGSHQRLRARSAGVQPAVNGGIEAS
jgi:hypothetical protein